MDISILDNRPKALRDKVFDRLFEESEIARFTKQKLHEYEDSKKAYRDIKNSIDTAKRDGIAEGIEIGKSLGKAEGIELGKAEGIELGKAEGIKLVVKKMLGEGVPASLVCKVTGLTETDIEAL